MFYDLEDPIAFARAVKQHLAPDGVWCFEMSYMPTMLRMQLVRHDLPRAPRVLQPGGARIHPAAGRMKVVRVSLNDCNGGSIRVHATHSDNFLFDGDAQAQSRMRELRQQEFDLQLDTDKPYRNFQERIETPQERAARRCLRRLKSSGKKIHIYGASTKGNTILQRCGIDNALVECAAERNPKKFGARTLGTNIPIVSEEESREPQAGLLPGAALALQGGVPRARAGDARGRRRLHLPAAADRDRDASATGQAGCVKRPPGAWRLLARGRDHAVSLPTMSQNTPWVQAGRRVLARKSALWAIACLAAAALWIDFSAIQRHQNSDTLMMVFISVYKWTPLFWEQDRLGMFFPLLALPWRDPWNNMLAQGAMTIFACLGGFFLLGYYTLGRSLGLVAGPSARSPSCCF